MTEVTLYTKPGCHLCEAVEQTIAVVARRRAFRLTVRNILDDPADFGRYQHAVPVVVVNGTEVARYRVSTEDFTRALDRADDRPAVPADDRV